MKKKPRQNIEFILGFKSNFFFQIFFEFVVLKDFFKGEKFGKNDPNLNHFILKKTHVFCLSQKIASLDSSENQLLYKCVK